MRLLYAWLLHRQGQLSILVAYTPTEDADNMAKDSFYHQLVSTIQSLPKHDQLLILGDVNANTGPQTAGFKDDVWPFGVGPTNDSSGHLLSLCSFEGIMATGLWFRR